MRSLRTQLIFSHLLPVIIIIPLIGIVLDYILETWVIQASGSTMTLRFFIIAVLVVGAAVGILTGWSLALRISRPIRRMADAVCQIAQEDFRQPIPEDGPEEIQQLAIAINTLVNRTQDLERSRKQLLANLVHELGRPLGALRAATHALQSGADQESELRADLLKGMDEELKRLQSLLEDLAHLTDKKSGVLELKPQVISLGEWLNTLMPPWREAAQEKHLHWEANLPKELPALCVDPDRLAQAVGNLISNAILYTPTGGKVSISAGSDAESTWIKVSDTGPGISPIDREHIFEPFFRGAQKSRFPQGMGLGLSIAHDLVAAHGGWIDVSGSPGLGSQFTIWLPIKKRGAGQC